MPRYSADRPQTLALPFSQDDMSVEQSDTRRNVTRRLRVDLLPDTAAIHAVANQFRRVRPCLGFETDGRTFGECR